MQQVIKFRAWNPILKMMEYEPVVSCSGLEYHDVNSIFSKEQGLDPRIWLQSTRLKSSSGKEIWVGDILKHPAHWSDGRTQSVAEMIYPFHSGDWSVDTEDCEIIGNIYEHPNLLSVDNK